MVGGMYGVAQYYRSKLEAEGYTVRIIKRRGGMLDVFAVGADRLFIAVVRGRRKSKVTARDIRRVVETARYLGARPVLALPRYAKLTKEAARLATKIGVEVQRLPRLRGGGR